VSSHSWVGHFRSVAFGVAAVFVIAVVAAVGTAAPPQARAVAGAAPQPVHASRGYLPRQTGELTATDPGREDALGSSVALAGDTALVGSPQHATSGLDGAGAAYLFARTGADWTRTGQLIAGDAGAWDAFGSSVALSGDTALVGSPGHAAGGNDDAGAAYVFTRAGGSWSQQALLVASDAAALEDFGSSVAISGDTAVIGAPYHTASGQAEAGAVYVFVTTGAGWSQQAELIASDAGAGDWLGTSVAVDGDTVVAGADGRGAGAAYVFTRSGSGWAPQAELTAPDGVNGDSFGAAVALAGETIIVGSPEHDAVGKEGAGAAYVFVRSGGAWAPQGELTESSPVARDAFGGSVALSTDTALVGAAGRDTFSLSDAGAASTFARVNGAWSLEGELTATDAAAGDRLGDSVSLSGRTALAGADGHAVGDVEEAGAAYAFALDAPPIPPAISSFAPSAARVGKTVTLIGEGFTDAVSVTFGGGAKAQFSVLSDARITTTVPKTAKSGRLTVITPLGSATSARSFTVLHPGVIKKLSPATCKRGAVVTITGRWFGARRGKSTVTFGKQKCLKFVSWSDKKIRCKVPRKVKPGRVAVRVQTLAGKSNAKRLRVKR
jgi:hypothetical protein